MGALKSWYVYNIKTKSRSTIKYISTIGEMNFETNFIFLGFYLCPDYRLSD